MTGRPGVEALSEKLLEATAGGPLCFGNVGAVFGGTSVTGVSGGTVIEGKFVAVDPLNGSGP